MAFWFFGDKKEDKIKKIEGDLKNSFSNIKRDFSMVHEFLSHFRKKHDDHDERFERIERELEMLRNLIVQTPSSDDERSIVQSRSIAFNRSIDPFMNVQSLKNTITPAQKKVIHALSLAEIPLEYEDLARELGLSIVTVRRHLNDLKRMGFDVKEKVNIENGRKVFFIEKTMKKVIMRRK
ncbi:MAG: HTH domain-containing protein [Nanoarchaeota archaeon]